jgi:integrase
VRKAYDVRRKDGTSTHVAEQRRAITGVSNAELNRELTILKRIVSLALQAGKLLHEPHIPLLRENNTHTGVFEPEQFTSVQAHLPAALQPIVEFAYITGWRIASEVLPLEWRNVDFAAGEVRLDAGTTKNGEGRVFPVTDDLRALVGSSVRGASTAEAGQARSSRPCSSAWWRTRAAARRIQNPSSRSRRRGLPRVGRPAALAASLTTYGARPSVTWCAAACPSASR